MQATVFVFALQSIAVLALKSMQVNSLQLNVAARSLGRMSLLSFLAFGMITVLRRRAHDDARS